MEIPALHTTIIRPKKTFHLNLPEIWQYRELFYTFAWRDIKVRYKQTVIGIAWAILQPFLLMVVFSVFFGKIAGITSGTDLPYPIFVYTGLLFWNFFSNSLVSASNSMVSNQSIIQKVYFPRLIVPLSSSIVFFIDFMLSAAIFIGLLIFYQVSPGLIGVILVIPSLIITVLSFSGLGLIFAAVNVTYRDVRYALPFFIQLLLFVTPVIYPTSVLGKYQWLWYLNPMSGVIDTMRAGLFGTGNVNWLLFGAAALMSVILFAIGFFYFKKTEAKFADII